MRSRFLALAVLGSLLTTNGCQKLNVEKTVNVQMGIPQEAFTVDPPRYQQKVTVTVEPQAASVSAYLIKSEEKDAVEKALQSDKDPPDAAVLGSRISKGDTEIYSFDATVPAKQGYTLMLKGNKKKSTDVKIKLVGK
jgi:hypothetical protein